MVGATTSQTLDLTLINKGDIVYGTSTIKVEIGLKVGSTVEYIPLGIYNIDDIDKTDYTIKITAFDNMIKFEKNFITSLGDTLTLQQVVSELTRITGVQFIGTLPSYTVKKLEGFTCREILSYVASLCGGNAVITRDGKFTIVTPKDINYSIGTSNYFDYTREETKYKIGKISCQAGEEVLSKGSIGIDSMELEFENPWVNATILTDIYNKLNGFEYLGYSMKWQGDPSIDVGDIVTITDKKGVVRKHPILSQKFTYTGGLTSEIGAKGENKNKNEFSSSGPSAKKVERVVMELALINRALIDVAYIGDLTANNIKFDTASGTIMDLQTLLVKFVSGENGQFLNLTTDNVVIANAVIKDAMIDSLSLNKLKAGTINTNNINLASADGGLSIVGPTMQFKDKSNKVRLQLGQDTAGDFNFILRAADGNTTLIDGYGIKEKAIADKLIKSNMVNDGAIGEQQINYSSLVTGLNKDTNTQLIKASKVAIDLTGQSLEVSFNSLKTSSDDTKSKTEINTTSIGIINGQIDTLIKDTTIEENGSTIKLKDSYSSLKQTVNGINTTVASHTTSITTINTNVTNAQNTANSANTLADSKAKVFTVTPTTPYKVGDIWTGGPSGELMKCKVARASGTYTASDWEKASKYTDDTKANAVEGSLNTLSGKVTTVENNYTNLSQDLSGFKTTVASNYSTKTELSTVEGKISSLTNRVNTAESSITQLNNKIALKVEATDIINAINNIEIGSKNLVLNSNTVYENSNYAMNVYTMSENWIVGQTYTMTIKGTLQDETKQKFGVWQNGGALNRGYLTKGSNGLFYLTFTAGAIISGWEKKFTIYAYPNTAGMTNKIECIKVEKGNKATDWTPAPEDVDQTITTVDGRVTTLNTSLTTTNTKVATIETNLTSITSRVSSTESSISTINGNVSSLISRMSSAESKITSSAIISTVQATINAAKTDAINSANSSTDTKLQSYATKASMELTATQLKLDFSSSGGYNLIRNGNFENGTYGWTTQVFGGDNSELSVSTTGSNDWIISNKKALWCFTNIQGAKERTIRQEIKTIQGKIYTLSYYIAGHRSAKVVRIRDTPNWNDLITPRTYGAINGGNSPSGWIYDSLTFTATSTTTLIFFDLRDIGTNSDGYMWVHDVTVVEGSLANPWIPNKEEIVNGSTVINGSGVTIYNGAITVKNNANVDVLKGDSSGNLTMRGVFEQYASSGKKSVDITNNKVNLYDWSRDGDLVGGIISVTGNADGRGKVMVYGDKGNPLLLGYCNLNRDTFYRVIAIDDVKVENSGQSMIGIYKDTSIMDYSSLTFYGNDNTVPIGRVGLASDNTMFILSRDTINSTYIGQMSQSNTSSYNNNARINGAGLHVWGNITCSGAKTRLVPTKSFDGVKLNALETSEPVFEDIGEGRIEKEGLCYIFLDPIMQETINSKCSYQVFLQKYGEGDLFVLERTENYFVIKGLAGLKFGWRFVAKQKGYETDRLEREVIELPEGFQKIEEKINEIDELTHKYLSDYEKELIENGEY